MFVTIWIALALFVAGEFGKPLSRRRHPVARSVTWIAYVTGGALCAVHVSAAMALRHDWSHASAVRATANQTAAVFGLPWGGGVYVNYLFVVLWLSEAIWWGAWPASFARRSRAFVRATRVFYLIVIANGAIIFAAPERRWLGAVIVAALLAAWVPRPRAHMKE